MTDELEMAAYYERGDEQARLQGKARLELVRTRELLARYMPEPPAVVLDVGGAAGVYALALAREGYEVHLLDPMALHVEQARAASAARRDAPVASAEVGDARELPFADASADVVLMLGPLYHLTEAADRARALQEAHRVLRPGGLLAAAAISRFASTLDGLFRGFLLEPGFEDLVVRDVAEGQHRNPERRPRWFTTAYFHRPDELEREVAASGLELQALLAVEGLAAMLDDVDALDPWLDDPARREVLLRAIRRVEAEPSLIGASSHLIAFAKAP
jgi:ubiquinone/menaquinone biosynthesis C-methylase UbiE